MTSTNQKMAMGLGVLTIGAALYLLSRDAETVIFDPKKHTVEELRKIVHEMFVEGATLYCQKLNLMRQAKASGEFKPDTLESFMRKQEAEMDEAEQDIYKENKLTEEFFADWLAKNENDPVIKGEFDLLKKIGEMVFDPKDGKIVHVPCKNMPENLTEDNYILIYRKQQACIRHQIYKILKETGGATQDPVKQREQQEKFMEVMKRRPEFQKAAAALYDIKTVDFMPLELIMREAYLDFYSKSLQPSNTDGFAYSKRLQKEQKEHNAMLEKILKENSTIPELEKDPLLTKDDLEPKKSNFKLGDDGMFLEKEGEKDESKEGIANKILEKMKQNKEEEEKKEEPTTEEGKQSARALDKEIENLEKVKELIDEKIEAQKPKEPEEVKPTEEKKDEKPAENKKEDKKVEDKKEEKPVEDKKEEKPVEDKKDDKVATDKKDEVAGNK